MLQILSEIINVFTYVEANAEHAAIFLYFLNSYPLGVIVKFNFIKKYFFVTNE